MTDLLALISENVPKVITSVAGTTLIALVGYLYRAGSWTKTHRRAQLLDEQGDRFMERELWDSALEKYKLAIQIWDAELNNARLLSLYHKVGKTYSQSGQSERALEALIQCEVLWGAIKKDTKIHEVYYELSEVYVRKKDFEKAATYAHKAIDALRTQQSPRLPVALAMSARIAKERGREEEAESEYLEAIRVLAPHGDTLGLASVYYELGNLKALRKQDDLAAAYYTKSADNYEKLGSARADEIRQKMSSMRVAAV